MKHTLPDIANLEKQARKLTDRVLELDIRKGEELGEIFWKDYRAAYASMIAINKFLEGMETPNSE